MKRILIADDDLVSRGLIRDILEPQGFEVIEATDGEEALSRIIEVQPDLILVDIQMPRLGGYGVLQRLREAPRFRAIPVAAISALAMQTDQNRGLMFDAYITKPISPAALRAQVRSLLLMRETALSRHVPFGII